MRARQFVDTRRVRREVAIAAPARRRLHTDIVATKEQSPGDHFQMLA